jgi:hypothetical protein
LPDVGSPIRHASHPNQSAEPTNSAPITLVIILMSFVQIACGTPLAQAKNASAAQARHRTKRDRKVRRGRYTRCSSSSEDASNETKDTLSSRRAFEKQRLVCLNRSCEASVTHPLTATPWKKPNGRNNKPGSKWPPVPLVERISGRAVITVDKHAYRVRVGVVGCDSALAPSGASWIVGIAPPVPPAGSAIVQV